MGLLLLYQQDYKSIINVLLLTVLTVLLYYYYYCKWGSILVSSACNFRYSITIGIKIHRLKLPHAVDMVPRMKVKPAV